MEKRVEDPGLRVKSTDRSLQAKSNEYLGGSLAPWLSLKEESKQEALSLTHIVFSRQREKENHECISMHMYKGTC